MTPPSPSILQPPPKRAPGIKRLNAVPYYVVGSAAVIVLGYVGYTLVSLHNRQQAQAVVEEASKKPKAGGLPSWMQWNNDHGDIQATVTKPVDHGEIPAADRPAAQTQPGTAVAPPDLEEQARAKAWAVYYQQNESIQASRLSASIAGRTHQSDAIQQPSSTDPGQPSPTASGQPPYQGARGKPYSEGGTDPAGQIGKQAFLRTPGDPLGLDEDLAGSVHGPKPSTIMEGTPIPGRLVDGATSDSPGQLVAEVTTNVYDDMTGTILLIPQYTRIITTYDTAVSAGQDRIGTIAQRLIFPDTSSRQLGTMQIADQAGLAGLKDIVKTHFWEKFWATAVVSLVGAGAQLAQPQQSAFSGYSPGSVASGQLTQGFSQLGQAYAQRGLSIPNTIELRPGLPLIIKPNHDITLPAYVDHRGLAGR